MIYKDKFLKNLKRKYFFYGFQYGVAGSVIVVLLYQFLTSNPLEWIL